MRFARWLALGFVLVGSAGPCLGQFVRPPVFVPRPPVHVPVHVPFQGSQQGNRDGGDPTPWVIGGLAVAGIVGGGLLIRYWWKRSGRRAVIRITATPPGEAPEFVRRAWIGLELPLIQGQTQTDQRPAQQVLSGRRVHPADSYAVDGSAAIKILDSACPEAARWWRDNAPGVLAPGYELVFPAQVCERLDDLGAHTPDAAA